MRVMTVLTLTAMPVLWTWWCRSRAHALMGGRRLHWVGQFVSRACRQQR